MLTLYLSEPYLAEKRYTAHVLLTHFLKVPFREMPAHEPGYTLELPNGNTLRLADAFFAQASSTSYLDAGRLPTGLSPLEHPFPGLPAVLPLFGNGKTTYTSGDHGLSLATEADLFASAFCMLTRWEETISAPRDRHGRFAGSASMAHRLGFLERPVVDEYAAWLRAALTMLGHPVPDKPAATLHLSCDVDHPLLWFHPSDRLKTLGGSLFKRFNPRETAYWVTRHLFSEKDPYDVFDEWMDLAEKRGLTWQFNFLGERRPSADCYYPLHHPFVLKLLEKIQRRGHRVGFHASYEAFDDPNLFHKELASLRAWAPVEGGRQHYLRFNVPDTWQQWTDAGLAWDSTAGYADLPGFRCGTSRPFPVFHIRTRQTLPLLEYPLLWMDVTDALYRRHSPAQAKATLTRLSAEVKRHGGTFGLLWHNGSWNTFFWEKWKSVFTGFLDDWKVL